MAEEVSLQQEGTRTLHINKTRRAWQILLLQGVATASLIWMFVIFVDLYIIPQADLMGHTTLLQTIDDQADTIDGSERSLPLPAWLSGMNGVGKGVFLGPVIFAAIYGYALAVKGFQTEKRKRRIRMITAITILLLLLGRLLMGYGLVMLWELIQWPFGNANFRPPTEEEALTLIWPLLLFVQFIVLLVYTLPVWLGTRGIWGLRRSSIRSAFIILLLLLTIHALITWDFITALISQNGQSLPIQPLNSQVDNPSHISLFGLGLAGEQQFKLVLFAVFFLIYIESGYGAVRYLDYAFKLPEACKKDPEYVRQFDNLITGHLWHTVGFFSIAAIAAMISMRFNEILLDLVQSSLPMSQWSLQLGESLELELTYGLVISALLFFAAAALLRFVVPWQSVFGFLEKMNPIRRR